VSYGGVQGLEIAARVRVRSTIKPEGIRGRTRVWYSKVRHGVCIPLPIHAGVACCGISRLGVEPGLVVEVIHRLCRGV
jgi:hypothetical protein